MKMLYDVGKLVKIERLLLYRMTSETEAEILLIFSTDDNETETVGQIVSIEGNPNLKMAVQNKELSQIPVPGMGIDAAFPVGHTNVPERLLVVGMDNSKKARKFSEKDMTVLKLTASMLAIGYNG